MEMAKIMAPEKHSAIQSRRGCYHQYILNRVDQALVTQEIETDIVCFDVH